MSKQEMGGVSLDREKQKNKELSIDQAVERVRKALQQIQYGEITIKVEAGKPIWVDKHERERVG